MRHSIYFLLTFLTFSVAAIGQNPRTLIEITARQTSVLNYTDREVVMNGRSDVRIRSEWARNALNYSIVRLNSEDAWLIFENIRPTQVIDSLLRFIFVNDAPAVNRGNVRVAVYAHGTVVKAHSPQFRPLTIFTERNFQGQSSTFPLFTYHNGLGVMDDRMRSIRLKRGYMATLATNADGSGYSRVFIADNEDIEFSEFDFLLDETVSFIRVFPWEYVTKKGWCGSGAGGGEDAERLRATWWYSWSADQESRTNQTYVPIKQNAGWPGWSEINQKQNVAHLLGFNEPDRPDQANMTVAQALAMWPDFMRSGLRIGTPATASPNAWLYEFIDSARARNWRIDFLAVHAYWGAKSPQSWYHDLRAVHLRTGLPIWLTEWNNGANWTTEVWPTPDRSLSPANAAKQLNDLRAILNVLDTASFIERHSLFNWVQDARSLILSGNYRVTVNPNTGRNDTVFLQNGLTPAGVMFRDTRSRMAFDRRFEVIPTFRLMRNPTLSVSFTASNLAISVNDPNGDFSRGFILERRVGSGPFEVIFDNNNRTVRNHSEPFDLSAGATKFRVRTKLPDGTLSNYSPAIGFDITQGDSQAQYGRVNLSSNDWNSVFFNQPFSEIPAIVTGSPTNFNVNALITPRIRFVSRTSRFQIQAATWQYLNMSSFGREETIPYFAILPGTHQFGDVRVVAARTTASAGWTNIVFPTPFEVDPVVFVNTLISSAAFPTVVRVRNVTRTGFQVRIFREEGVTTVPPTESITYVAMSPGRGNINGQNIIVGRTADNFAGATARQILFGDTIQNPIFIAQMQTTNDEITSALRTFHEFDRGAFVFKQRERSVSQGSVLAEGVGWMVIDPAPVVQNLPSVKYRQLTIRPNPVRDILYLQNDLPEGETVHIYNLTGMLVMSVVPTANSIDVSQLESGSYIIRGASFSPTKFLKL